MVSSDNNKILALKNQIVTKINSLINTHNSNTSAHSDIRNNIINYGVVDSTSTSTVFTATVPNLNAYTDGATVMLRNGVVTSESGFTLNVNGLGAKPVYTNLASATRDTTIFNINYTMLFVYDSTRVDGGCWVCYRGYDANTNTIGYQIRTNSMSYIAIDKGYRYRLWLETDDGKYMPVNTSTSTNATANRSSYMNTREFWINGNILYNNTTGTTNAEASMPTLWKQYTLTLGYSFNNTGSALTLTFPSPVYMVAKPTSNGKAQLHTPYYTQTLPSAEDGLIYIYLGHAYSATAIELTLDHPVYEYKNGGIRLYSDAYTTGDVDDLLDGKVDKVTGKGLSSEDFTSTLLTKLNGIEEGATNTVVDNSLSKTSTNPVQNVVINTALLSKASSNHSHGNLDANGSLGKSGADNKNVVTDANGFITTEDKPTIPSKTSDLTNDSGFLTEHQDISGKVNVSDIKDNLTSTDTNKPLSAKQGKELKTLVDGKASSTHTHTKSQITDFAHTHSEYVNPTIIDNLTTSDSSKVLSAKQGKVLNDKFTDYLTITDASGTYVAKENGKGLSSNDYTSDEKTKLGELPTRSQLNSMLDASFSVQPLDDITVSELISIYSSTGKADGSSFFNYASDIGLTLSKNVIYLVFDDTISDANDSFYNEYIYITEIDGCELLGSTKTEVDLSNYPTYDDILYYDYATHTELSNGLEEKADVSHDHNDLYYTKYETDNFLDEKADTNDIPDVSEFITESAITTHNTDNTAHSDIRNSIPTKTSDLTNDSGFLTEHQSLANYLQKSNTNGLVKNDGTIDTNNYLTEHQDISGKANSADLATVATTGSYNDLTGKPTIPTKVSDLTNDSNFVSNIDIQASNYNPNIDDTITITITVTDQDDNPITNKSYTLKENGETLTTLTTDSNGVATYTYNCDNWGVCRFSVKSYSTFIRVTGQKIVKEWSGWTDVYYRLYVDEANRNATLSMTLSNKNIASGTSNYEMTGWIPSKYRPHSQKFIQGYRGNNYLFYVFYDGRIGVANLTSSTQTNVTISAQIDWNY